MTLTSDQISPIKTDEVNSTSSENQVPEEVADIRARTDEEEGENLARKQRQDCLKTRSVSFNPTVEEFEIPSREHSSFSPSYQSMDFIDAFVQSYKLQILANQPPIKEEKQYTPKTTRTRLNPNWREHRIRRLMNKLEELSLWDREQELKFTQAQSLRQQKLEQIQDRQRNHDLCLYLMRQRHESEIESALLLDHVVNDENTNAKITRAISLTNDIDHDLSIPPVNLKRRIRQNQEQILNLKTPLGRYRQFETNMNNKLNKINEKLQPDWQIMRAYRTPIPSTVVPLFSETYAALLSIPDIYSTNKYNQYHYNIGSYRNYSPQHASSPDYERHIRANSNRDVRVPFKDEINDNHDNYDDDDNDNYNRRRLSVSPPKRPLNINSNSTSSSLYDYLPSKEYSLIYSPQSLSNNIHQRSLNDDLNGITKFSGETNKNILRNINDISNGILTKNRSLSVPTNKRVTFIDQYDDNQENYNYNNKGSKMIYQPEMISVSFAR